MITDDEIKKLIELENNRQRTGLELIPSENYVSRAVLDAMGSVLTNKYSEGYPGKRYYGGQEFTDQIENLAIYRAKKLFKADHANVQLHSGAPANEAVYSAWLDPGDTIMAMELSHGGHLTHGSPVTRSGKLYNFIRYKMKDVSTGEIDYDELRTLARTHKPKLIMVGYSSYPREIDYQKVAEIGNEIGALLVADIAHIAGLIAAKVLKNPFDYGFHVMTSTTHKTLRGPRGGLILSKGIVGNSLKASEKSILNIPNLIDRAVFPGMQGGPHMHIIAAKAVAFFEATQPEFTEYANQIIKNAQILASSMKERGFNLITGGTSNHLILSDVYSSFNLSGDIVEKALDKIGLTVNKNVIPDDVLPPFRPSGIRLGTAAVTTRGLKESDMVKIADWLVEAINNHDNESRLNELKKEVSEYSLKYKLPSDLG